ncbi:5-(carboxyamino)imidazole ribonucleotide synthase [Occultella glacieicola]|uniref:N5-carboxyaminoimidazole ribonucleotide synthase n=1 Tax=Occultella glacieicola TaxID=2518684 RepID=A0ABY2DWI4_9MICO|nr:5-(carboxyamino)imidazole ribonucleotide synthase [Occultella glacieicola]TDE88007.1 5-(carboxyamino)imidazole ribonucleotide synthase [Occultella glacieicola]
MGPVVAVVGGGQLARMMAEPAGALQIRLRALVEAADGAAAQVIPDAPVGAADDLEAVVAVAAGADVLTFEHEHVPQDLLTRLIADGVNIQPGPGALRHAQDKIVMRTRLTELGVPCPRWAAVATPEELTAFGDRVGWPVIAKTPVGGYDGKGVLVVHDATEAAHWLDGDHGQILVEERVGFRRELAALVARRPSGQMATWPVVETIQENGVCAEVVAPAPDLPEHVAEDALDVARTIAEGLDVTGVLAVEMFEAADGVLLVNELAMRPHNSGHFSLDGSVTSQFEQHLRAVLDLPLGDTSATAPWSVMVNLLGSELADPASAYPDLMAAFPDAKVHLYGKSVRPGRKLGHVTVTGTDLAEVRRRARAGAAILGGTPA